VIWARWARDVKNSLKRCPAVPSSRSSRRNHREALVPLSIEELEALTAFFATQTSSLQAALLKWGAGMAWAGREVMDLIEGEYDRLLRDKPK
jgi:hypothetical protein